MASRRLVLMFMLLGLVGQAAPKAFAKDGDSGSDGGGSDGGSDDGGDSDDGGSDDGGSDDNDNSGSGSSDDGDDDGGKTSTSKNDDDNKRIRSAVRDGKAEPLRKILSTVRKRYKGEVVRIRLSGKGKGLLYRIRIIEPSNRLIEVRVNASTGRIVGAAGF
jgi:Peptidase propeptide and YPEB domain